LPRDLPKKISSASKMSLIMMDLRKKILKVIVKGTKRKMRRAATITRVTWVIFKIRCPQAVKGKRKRRGRRKRKRRLNRSSKRGRKRRRKISRSRSV
jgi:hypothetical protein